MLEAEPSHYTAFFACVADELEGVSGATVEQSLEISQEGVAGVL